MTLQKRLWNLANGIIAMQRSQRPRIPARHKLNALELAIDFWISNNIVGDYLEFGVFQGKSFTHACRYIDEERARYLGNKGPGEMDQVHQEFMTYRPRFFAFDSFEGLPFVEDTDIPAHWRGKNVMKCPKDRFVHNIAKGGVDLSRTTVVEGYYCDILTERKRQQLGVERAAVVNIDCDLYESTVDVLQFITPLIGHGTVLYFDDWDYYRADPQKGEQGAFNEWLKVNAKFSATQLCKYSPAASYVIHVSGS